MRFFDHYEDWEKEKDCAVCNVESRRNFVEETTRTART